MSYKPSRTAKSSAASSETGGHAGQSDDADIHLAKGRYRDAIEAYKRLLKQARRPEWIEGLAAAYAGRAQSLADKDMRREAIALWQNRADLCGKPLWEGPYLEWIIAEGRLADGLKYLSLRYAADAPADELVALEARLAPALLSADAALVAGLPATMPLLRHHPAAHAALMAYAQNDAAALDAALASIPFRSPYRDLRPILKAMLLLETDALAARAAIERLPVDGPFERLAAPLRVLALPPDAQLSALVKLSLAQQRIAFDLLGVPTAIIPLASALATAGGEVAPEALFDLLLRHYRALSAPLASRLWRQLAPWSPKRIGESLRWCDKLPPGAEACARARAEEIKGDLIKSEPHWKNAVTLFAASEQTTGRLCAALILRHMALFPDHLSRDGQMDEAGEDMLTRSLNYDMYDRDTHVRLVAYWRDKNNLKRARARLDFALTYFPDDTAVLAEAIATALAGGAFKRASTLARRLLALDPLNSQVRSLVGNAHLSHAGKQIIAGKPEAARDEISEAADWLNTPIERGRMRLLRAWSYPATSPERQQNAREAVACWGGGLAAGWRLLREAQDVFPRAKPAQLLQDAGVNAALSVTWSDLLVLVQQLETEVWRVRRVLDPLSPWRKSIEKLANTRVFNALPDTVDAIRICEAFSRHHEYGLLERFAEAGQRRWRRQPIFVYHAVAARFERRQFIVNDHDYDALERAYQIAEQNNDRKLLVRMDALFEASAPSDFGPFEMPSTPDILNPQSQDGAMLRTMIRMMVMTDGEKSFLKMAKDAIGNAVFSQMEKDSGGNRAVFVDQLIDFLVVAGSAAGIPPPFWPAQSIPAAPKPIDPRQGGLFDD